MTPSTTDFVDQFRTEVRAAPRGQYEHAEFVFWGGVAVLVVFAWRVLARGGDA